jgi:hypothetical protein
MPTRQQSKQLIRFRSNTAPSNAPFEGTNETGIDNGWTATITSGNGATEMRFNISWTGQASAAYASANPNAAVSTATVYSIDLLVTLDGVNYSQIQTMAPASNGSFTVGMPKAGATYMIRFTGQPGFQNKFSNTVFYSGEGAPPCGSSCST